nr:MAG TPA: hypothetical protein [Caudoviricetes sp.]
MLFVPENTFDKNALSEFSCAVAVYFSSFSK